ncbi:hypothetical protein C1H46_039752 [Malus baccata]|uniref:non-specific serine/threonine protein kinase n=1 Tax=Malus baccata TaxID=106549 RepID=A0A540KKH0_MALBA|nr:hypothetical protein C1H46_039752 [Malus baccata]
MGNCCVTLGAPGQNKNKNNKKKTNPFATDFGGINGKDGDGKLLVLKDPTGRDISAQYDLGRELGRGEFGVTYLCTEASSDEKFACKSISKKKLRTAVDIEDVRREVEIMQHLPPHPNIVTLKDTYEDGDAVHIVMELCEGGELFDRIVARGHYTERAAAGVMRTIVEVVQVEFCYGSVVLFGLMCHKHGVMHRDLKPENFLFANKKETASLKAIDFGLSVFFKPGEQFNEIVGSPYYMAPEVLKRNYGPEVDIWSAGVILYILLCGVPPFWAETEQGVAQAIIRSVVDFKRDPWPRVSDNAKDLVKKMLDPDPKKRLTAKEVLDHPWIQNAKKAPNVPLGETVRARLQQFSVMNKLKKRALGVIAEHLSVAEVAGIKEAFQMMDTGNKGKVTIEELRSGIQQLGQNISDPDLQILMEAADVDGDGALNYGEFVVVTVIADHLSVAELAGIKEAFQMMGTGNKGKVTIEELRSGIQQLGQNISDPDLQILMEAADVDGDGALNYGEFVVVTVHLKKMANDEHLHKAFAFFDQNQSGHIEIEELRNALTNDVDVGGEEVIHAIMHDVDTDKDGRISYEEFAAMMKAGTDWRKASRQYSRERFNSISLKLMREGSFTVGNEGSVMTKTQLPMCFEWVSNSLPRCKRFVPASSSADSRCPSDHHRPSRLTAYLP